MVLKIYDIFYFKMLHPGISLGYAKVRYSRFNNGLCESIICRCFVKPDPVFVRVAPMRGLGLGFSEGSSCQGLRLPVLLLQWRNFKRRRLNCGIPSPPVSCTRLLRRGAGCSCFSIARMRANGTSLLWGNSEN